MIQTPYTKTPTVDRVTMFETIVYFCKLVGIPYEVLISKTRKREVLKYRQMIACYLDTNSNVHGDKYFLESQTKIGILLGGKDHSSVNHCTSVVLRDCENNLLFKIEYQQYESKLNEKIKSNEKENSNNNI